MGKKIVIVGGVAGGATAAARLRRLDESAEITVIERTGFVSYANCGLPYYVGGVIPEKKSLTLQTPQSFRSRFNIDVRVESEVTAIDRGNKRVTVRNLADGGEYSFYYLAMRKETRNVLQEIGRTFSMLCGKEDDPAFVELGRRLFNLTEEEVENIIQIFDFKTA